MTFVVINDNKFLFILSVHRELNFPTDIFGGERLPLPLPPSIYAANLKPLYISQLVEGDTSARINLASKSTKFYKFES